MPNKCQGCQKKRASYGYDNHKKIWCSPCSQKKYVELNIDISRRYDSHNKCQECHQSQPNYGYDGNKYMWCGLCSQNKYAELNIDVSRRCDANNKCQECHQSQPSYGYDGKKKIWCGPCSQKKYAELNIDISRRCDAHNKCQECHQSGASYGYDGNKSIWCSPCSQKKYAELNIDVSRRCDANKKCQECHQSGASYGYDGKKKIWCSPCSQKKYAELNIDVNRRCDAQKKCQECHQTRASYGYDGNKTIWCGQCSQKKYMELNIDVSRRCDAIKKCIYTYPDGTTCPIQTSTDKPLCVRHDTSQSRRRKSREMEVVDFLRSQNNSLASFLHNPYEVIEHSSFRHLHYFPDVLYDCGEYFVHLEIDEDQHKTYNCECQRILEMNQSRPKPTLLIRYNPDTVHFNGEKIKIPNKKRLATLVSVLTWAMSEDGKHITQQIYSNCQNSVVPPILVLYMYYDEMGWNEEQNTSICELRTLSIDKDNYYFSEQFLMPNSLESLLKQK